MTKVHLVSQGETLSTIARLYGFSQWETLWSENAKLRERRSNPHLLLPGDEVEIPERTVRSETAGTELKHLFRAKSSDLELEIILKDLAGEAVADVAYVLEIGEHSYEGRTDNEGSISQPVTDADATATLILKLGGADEAKKNELRIPLEIGSLDPVDTLSGFDQRRDRPQRRDQ